MKQVIDGKLYNTDTAEKIHNDWNGHERNQFEYCEETLYKTKKGKWFLWGDGGAMSKYSTKVGNSWTGDTKLIPLTSEQALRWLEDVQAPSDVILAHFGNLVREA